MTKRPCIWLTRPYDDSVTLADALAERGIDSIVAPVMHIAPAEFTIPTTKPDALLITSRHAAHALAHMPIAWSGLPIFCVGDATAATARDALCPNITIGDGDVLSLIPNIIERFPTGGRLLYFAGSDTRTDVATLLAPRAIETERVTTYHAIAEEELPHHLLTALEEERVTAASFFSPRSAALACALLQHAVLDVTAKDMTAYCLSLATAEAAAKLPWRALHVSASPTRSAMIELIANHLP